MNAEEAWDDYIMDTFINGLWNTQVRQGLFENKTMTLRTAYAISHNLEVTQR